MYCPNCGRENSEEQKFCRNCGSNLEKAAESLTEQRLAGLTPVDRRLERFGNFAFGGLALVGLAGVAGLIYTVITKFILTGTGVAFGIIITLFLIFATLGLVYVALNESRRSARKPKAGTGEIQPADTAKLLKTGGFEPIPSVVEDTTELLGVENKTRRL